MTDNEMIKYLRTKGLSNGASLGSHSGTMDLIADRFIELLAENNRQQAEIERLEQSHIVFDVEPSRELIEKIKNSKVVTVTFDEEQIRAEAVKEFAESFERDGE